MSDLLIRDFSTPSNCMECEWRDAEACGQCELMIDNPFLSFSDQYAHCPFQMIAKRHPLVPVPPHGRLIDADALMKYAENVSYKDEWYMTVTDSFVSVENIVHAPTIIEAEEGE